MLAFIVDNIATIAVCLILAGIAGAIIARMVIDRKKGVSSCGCGCSSCPMSSACHQKK
ncbi:MAG TPA: FeoB-associated Cys-rich membrane protein [Bacillota bacterium]|nr:FeoB-associated Cys-rich membrane protein [Clostridiales bacterium]HOQ13906.1 FeoB-associated Cys-rich membrane protein [Bacillota bacterium]HPU17763.1 FeoB-associated Cys-rich membrane protein [Bacillota bacterium]